MDLTMPWWVWGVLAALLGLAELYSPGVYLLWIGVGAAMTGAIEFSIPLLPVEHQILVFAAASIASCVAGYFIYRVGRSTASIDHGLNQRHLAMIGSKGTICEAFRSGQGKIRLADSVWLAEGPDMPEGTEVVVKSVRGTRLRVEKVIP